RHHQQVTGFRDDVRTVPNSIPLLRRAWIERLDSGGILYRPDRLPVDVGSGLEDPGHELPNVGRRRERRRLGRCVATKSGAKHHEAATDGESHGAAQFGRLSANTVIVGAKRVMSASPATGWVKLRRREHNLRGDRGN